MPSIVLLNNSQQKAFTTLYRMKAFLSLGTDKHDSTLTLLINQATVFIENYLGRRLLSQTYTNEEYDGKGTSSLVLKQYPVTTFTQLQENAAGDNTDDWQTIGTTDYFVDLATGIIKLLSNTNAFNAFDAGVFLDRPQKYRATYVAGYLIDFDNENTPASHTLPFDIEYTCQFLVSAMFNRRRAHGFDTTRVGDISTTMRQSIMQDKDIKELLDKHARFTI